MNTNEPGESGTEGIKFPEYREFVVWFEAARDAAGIKNDYEVARLAGINHSGISAWRKGRQRPNAFSLSAIARVFGTSALEAWAKAGLLTDVDREQMMTPAEREGVEVIRSSTLAKPLQDKLIAVFLEQERRDREEKLRRIREQIELAAGSSESGR